MRAFKLTQHTDRIQETHHGETRDMSERESERADGGGGKGGIMGRFVLATRNAALVPYYDDIR